MNTLARAWLVTLVVSAALTIVVGVLARFWRRHDARGWHVVYTVIAGTSLLVPCVSLVLPTIRVIWHSSIAQTTPGMLLLSAGISTPKWLIGIYLTGVVASVAHLMLGMSIVRQLRRTARAPHGALLDRITRIEGIDVLRCRWHGRVQSPVTIGAVHPLVVLPETAVFWPDARLHAVLRHEFAHVRRRDYFWNLVAACHRIVYWPNPMAWWLVRRARLAAELAADREASSVLGEEQYVGVLVQSAREFIAAGPSAQVVAPGAGTDLFARLEALMRPSTGADEAMPRTARAALLCAMVLMLVAASAVRFQAGAAHLRPTNAVHTVTYILGHQHH